MNNLDLQAIKQRRKQAGYSMSRMAESLGMANASVYWKYENGVYAFKADHLPQLAQVLMCEITVFFAPNVSKTATPC